LLAESLDVSIETGIQNSGPGLLLVFTFFDGLGGMAILVVFWGIWHLVAGMLLALFWANQPFKRRID
jgi:bile acid:Na+ symporter, BASS family